jgi:hypothetical protein
VRQSSRLPLPSQVQSARVCRVKGLKSRCTDQPGDIEAYCSSRP